MPKADPSKDKTAKSQEADDPVLLMLGVGKHLWKHEPGDKFVERLRADDGHVVRSPVIEE